jgi:hypothetical protein
LLGEFLKKSGKNPGARLVGGGDGAGGAVKEPPANVPTLADIGISKKESSTAQLLASVKRPLL